jgi:thiol-disulfide isomerase/thioredoxin
MKKHIIAFCLSTLLIILIAPFGGEPFGHNIKFSLALFSYFLLTYLYLRKRTSIKEQLKIVGTITLPVFLVYGVYFNYKLGFTFFHTSTLSTIAHFIGIFSGFMITHMIKPIKIITIILLLLCSIWVSAYGYSLWLNKVNFGAFYGQVNETLEVPLYFYSANGSKYQLTNLKDKIIILDFWNSGCGYCFKSFPITSEKYSKYRSDSCIRLFAINIPLKGDSLNTPFNIINNLKYEFPVLVDRNFFAKKILKIYSVPTVLIMKNKIIYYRGTINSIDDFIRKIKTNNR